MFIECKYNFLELDVFCTRQVKRNSASTRRVPCVIPDLAEWVLDIDPGV